MSTVLIAACVTVLAALILSFAAYGGIMFAMACRQKRQSNKCCSWSDAWDIVKSQWNDHVLGDTTEPRQYDDSSLDAEIDWFEVRTEETEKPARRRATTKKPKTTNKPKPIRTRMHKRRS